MDIIGLIEDDEREFVESMGGTLPEKPSEVDSRIDWLLERIGKRQAMIEQNDAVAKERILQMEDWRQGENAKLERAIEWFRYEVKKLLPMDAKSFQQAYGKKSRTLPFGTVGYKKHPAKIEITDADRALLWAKAHNLPVTVKESVSKTVLKEAVENITDNPDGFGVLPGHDEFFVRTNEQGKEKGN